MRGWRPLLTINPFNQNDLQGMSGGGTGIRTQETLSRLTVFKTAAFNHSAIPPRGAPPVSSYSVRGRNGDTVWCPLGRQPEWTRVARNPRGACPTGRDGGACRQRGYRAGSGRAGMTARPRMYGRSASGTTTEPSAC